MQSVSMENVYRERNIIHKRRKKRGEAETSESDKEGE